MKKILVPVDFSSPSMEAVKFAINLASRSKGEIKLIHVVELPVLYDSTLMPALSFEKEFYAETKQNTEKKLQKLKLKLKKDGLRISTVVEVGYFNVKLMEIATKWKAEIIVMGTHGTSGLKDFIIGSNTEKVVRQADVPVMAIRKSLQLNALKDIVFALPPGDNNESLINEVTKFQAFLKARLHLVYINTPGAFQNDEHSISRMKALAKTFNLKNFTINVYNDFTEEEGLKHFALTRKANVIAMATHGRTGLAHFFAGSITEDTVNHLDVPIWTYSIKQHPIKR